MEELSFLKKRERKKLESNFSWELGTKTWGINREKENTDPWQREHDSLSVYKTVDYATGFLKGPGVLSSPQNSRQSIKAGCGL